MVVMEYLHTVVLVLLLKEKDLSTSNTASRCEEDSQYDGMMTGRISLTNTRDHFRILSFFEMTFKKDG